MKQIIRRVAALVVGLGLGAAALAGLEAVTHISDLNASWPLGSDLASTSDDHIRNIKSALKTDFPNVNGAVNPTPAQFNQLTSNTFTSAVTGNSFIPSSSTVPTNGIYLPAANTLGFASNTTKWGSVNSTGNWVLVAPTSGVPITTNVTRASGANATVSVLADSVTGAQTAGFGIRLQGSSNAGGTLSAIGFEAGGSGTNNESQLSLYTQPSAAGGLLQRVLVGSAGNVTINAPSSGNAMTVTAVSGSAALSLSGQQFFNAQRITSSLTLSNSTVTDLLFNSTNTQNGGTNYATGTGIFTAPVAGIYVFSVEVETATSGGLTNSINAIYFSKNNSTSVGASRFDIPMGQVPSSEGTGITWRWGGSVTLSLAASDTVRVKFDNGAGTGGTIVMSIGSWFTGYLLG